jgi:uncharacterized protein (TIGR02246 family)
MQIRGFEKQASVYRSGNKGCRRRGVKLSKHLEHPSTFSYESAAMTLVRIVVLSLFAVGACRAAGAQGIQVGDEARLRQVISEQESAWNRGNAQDYCARFQANGAFTALTGTTYDSRDAFQARVTATLAGVFSGSTISYKVRNVRFVRPDVAIVNVDTETSAFKALPPGVQASADGKFRTSTLQLMVKERGEWWVAAFHNVDVK